MPRLTGLMLAGVLIFLVPARASAQSCAGLVADAQKKDRACIEAKMKWAGVEIQAQAMAKKVAGLEEDLRNNAAAMTALEKQAQAHKKDLDVCMARSKDCRAKVDILRRDQEAAQQLKDQRANLERRLAQARRDLADAQASAAKAHSNFDAAKQAYLDARATLASSGSQCGPLAPWIPCE